MYNYCFVYKMVGRFVRKYILSYKSKREQIKITEYCRLADYSYTFISTQKKLPVDMTVKDFIYIDTINKFGSNK